MVFRSAMTEQYPDLVELEQLDLRTSMGGKNMDGAAETEGRTFSRSLLRHLYPVALEHVIWRWAMSSPCIQRSAAAL